MTDSLTTAPHKEEVLERFEKVEKLEDEIEYTHADKRKVILRDLYREFHPHPMLIHLPIGSLILGTLFEFPAIASGIFSWWLNYDSVLISIFKKKMLFSIIHISICCFIVAARFFVDDISIHTNILSLIYNILIFCNVPFLVILGFYGGKITWH